MNNKMLFWQCKRTTYVAVTYFVVIISMLDNNSFMISLKWYDDDDDVVVPVAIVHYVTYQDELL